MTETASSFLAPWSNFYVIIGSSAAALTGLMFVVITLVTGTERIRKNPAGIATFSTPTVVHFSAALLTCATLSAPWRLLLHPAILLALYGACGVIYALFLISKARQLTTYEADIEDWSWYMILPLIAYGAILIAAIRLPFSAAGALFVISAGAALLNFIGIHNAWDIVTYIVIDTATESER